MASFYRITKNIGVYTAFGFLGWISGSINERLKTKTSLFENNDIILDYLPGLPVFGTVSAATPISTPPESRLAAVQNRTSQIMKFGFPSLDHVRSYSDFVLSFDRRTRIANWVFEHLTPDRLKYGPQVDRAMCEFTEDSSIHPYFRATNKDYKGSGYDRGHLAAAGNHKLDQVLLQDTFFLTNIAPQVGVGFNRDKWNSLEKYVRKLTKTYSNVYVCTGPLFLPKSENGKNYVKYEVIGTNHIAVPSHFFKVIVMETKDNKLHMEAYVLPNQAISDDVTLSKFQVLPDVIERAAGLLFFDRLSREKLVQINGRKTTYI